MHLKFRLILGTQFIVWTQNSSTGKLVQHKFRSNINFVNYSKFPKRFLAKIAEPVPLKMYTVHFNRFPSFFKIDKYHTNQSYSHGRIKTTFHTHITTTRHVHHILFCLANRPSQETSCKITTGPTILLPFHAEIENTRRNISRRGVCGRQQNTVGANACIF